MLSIFYNWLGHNDKKADIAITCITNSSEKKSPTNIQGSLEPLTLPSEQQGKQVSSPEDTIISFLVCFSIVLKFKFKNLTFAWGTLKILVFYVISLFREQILS